VGLAAYRAAFDHQALMTLADPAGNIIRANDLFCQTSGCLRAELCGRAELNRHVA
jgi:PAS domain S-box-containing protein